MTLLALEAVTKRVGNEGVHAPVVLDGVSFEVGVGESVGVWGMRRSGKSTLLRIAAGLESPDFGAVRFEGRDLGRMTRRELALLLRTKIGLASTERHVTRNEIVVDHIALPTLGLGSSLRDAQQAARNVLERVGATDCADARMAELAPGERTRVAIARGLVRNPKLLLVDEPGVTPSPMERDGIYALLRALARDPMLTLIVASEDVGAIRTTRRAMALADGVLRSSARPGEVGRSSMGRASLPG